MHAFPAVIFLFAALACAFIGRILLINVAFGVSTVWGFTVLFVPFGPFFFRMNYRELAYPTRYWRMATLPLFALFIVNGGSTSSLQSFRSLSLDSLKTLGKPTSEIASAGDTNFHLSSAAPVATPAFVATPAPVAGPAAVPVAAPSPATVSATAQAPTATPSKGVAAAMAAMPTAPKVLSVAERMDANRKEFERLAEWYTNLKNERGYLRKGDTDAVVAYNAEAAKYQTALQLAKTEQADLLKLAAKQ